MQKRTESHAAHVIMEGDWTANCNRDQLHLRSDNVRLAFNSMKRNRLISLADFLLLIVAPNISLGRVAQLAFQWSLTRNQHTITRTIYFRWFIPQWPKSHTFIFRWFWEWFPVPHTPSICNPVGQVLPNEIHRSVKIHEGLPVFSNWVQQLFKKVLKKGPISRTTLRSGIGEKNNLFELPWRVTIRATWSKYISWCRLTIDLTHHPRSSVRTMFPASQKNSIFWWLWPLTFDLWPATNKHTHKLFYFIWPSLQSREYLIPISMEYNII